MKLELGAGHRPTRGYEHNDLHPFDHIEHVGVPWMLDLPDESVEEVLALAFIEHLTFDHAKDTFRNVCRMLEPGGVFLFDVPDYPRWASYYLRGLAGDSIPVTMDHVRRTLFGWGRWPGDEHRFGWDYELLRETLAECGFTGSYDNLPALQRRTYRSRFYNPDDAHFYMTAFK